ncbi:response regulator [Desulfonatronum sp. SC1]|uniref:response regulator n=1 Tax=Desulfonatronum sp. SC1 TaxID=2109626 RepID=UPI000D30D376|nr:response regulator [Desulfonatronum sp. SC1]PTN37318.1 two-component system response regulator [Desulfonatronum sp. SC1]
MSTTPPKVLILEDEQQLRCQLSTYFEDMEVFHVVEAETGEEALVMLRSEPADLCIVDIRLPGMDGTAFIRASVQEKLCRHFLVHTGSVDAELHATLVELGVADRSIFLKPCDLTRLLGRVRELLRPGKKQEFVLDRKL